MHRHASLLIRIAAALLLGLVLSCIGPTAIEARADDENLTNHIAIAGTSYFKTQTITHAENSAIESGEVTFDPVANRITLRNAVINAPDGEFGIHILGGYVVPAFTFTIELEGENSIYVTNHVGIYTQKVGSLYIKGSGTLDLTHNSDAGIATYYNSADYGAGSVHIEDGATVRIHSTGDGVGIDTNYYGQEHDWVDIQDSTLIVDGTHGRGVEALTLKAENSHVAISAVNKGLYVDAGNVGVGAVWAINSTVIVNAAGEDGIGIYADGITREEDCIRAEGNTEILVTGTKQAYEGDVFNYIEMDADSSNPMRLEAGMTTAGADAGIAETYSQKTSLRIGDAFHGRPFTSYRYLHILPAATASVTASIQTDLRAYRPTASAASTMWTSTETS